DPSDLARWKALCGSRDMLCEIEPEPIDFAPYVEHPTLRRQAFWLGYTSKAIRNFSGPGSRLLDIGSNIQWLLGVAACRQVTMVDVRPHPLSDVFPFEFVAAN